MSLGANFNDRNMTLCSVQLKIKSDSFCTCHTSGSHCRRFSGCRKHNVFVSGCLHLRMGAVVRSVRLAHAGTLCRYDIFCRLLQRHFLFRKKKRRCHIFYIVHTGVLPIHSEVALHLRNFHRLQRRFRAGRWQDIFLNPLFQ